MPDPTPKWPTGPKAQFSGNNSPSGAANGGANTKGSATSYSGPSGFFEYGSKHGYINPFGKIKYGTKAPGPSWKGEMVPWKTVQKQSWAQGKPVPAVRSTPPSFADPDYVAGLAELQAQYKEEQASRLYNLSNLRDQFSLTKKQLGRARETATEDASAQLGAQGVAESGMADDAMTKIQQTYQEMLRDAMRKYGPKAQALEKTMLNLAAQRFRESESAQALLSGYNFNEQNPEDTVKVNKKKDK